MVNSWQFMIFSEERYSFFRRTTKIQSLKKVFRMTVYIKGFFRKFAI